MSIFIALIVVLNYDFPPKESRTSLGQEKCKMSLEYVGSCHKNFGGNLMKLSNRMMEWIKKVRAVYMCPTRDSFQTKRHMQTESEGKGKHLSCKWK